MLRLAAALLVTLAPAAALAAETPWQEIAPGVKARMISSDAVGADGTTRVGLELDMPGATDTYWRIPGEAGIATEFDFSGTTGLKDPQIEWPYPEIDTSRGVREYVFHGHFVLPIRLVAEGDSATLSAAVLMGVCSDICVPVKANFMLPIVFGKQDPEQSLRLQMAEAQLPIEWNLPQEPFGPIALTEGGLTIDGVDHSIDPESVIADVGDPAVLFGAPQKGPDGKLWTLPVLGGTETKGLEGRSVQLTFTTALGPYVVSRVIGAQK